MEELLKEIVAREWEMFRQTRNVGGRASCQEDPVQFGVMRSSQFLGWNQEALESYLEDLKQAREQGRNLPTEKYARMMEQTAPAEYAKLADRLPPLSEAQRQLADALTAQTVAWCLEFAAQYPAIAACGRPIRTADECCGATSVETYSHGEFLTYSEETLRRLFAHYTRLKAEGINLHREVVENEMCMMGFASLEEAEQRLKR